MRRPGSTGSDQGIAARLLSLLACGLLSACGGASPALTHSSTHADARPRLMLVVVIDQLGSDAFRKLEPLLSPAGALRTLARRGRLYEQVEYGYAATYTAPGHAAIYSGAVPRDSGVTSNYWIERSSGRSRSVVDDGQHAVFGQPHAHAGPDALRSPTIADALKQATDGRGKVASLSLKDRAAVIPGGKRPDLVLWYEPETHGFTTSTYYADALPDWLTRFQHARPITPGELVWTPAEPTRLAAALGADDGPGEGDYRGVGTTFPHRLEHDANGYQAWRMFPQSSEYLVELALETVRALQLGADDTPDLLALSLSGPDYAGHVFGPDSWEYADHLRRADLAIARLIAELSSRTRLSVLITSDHGVAPLPERLGSHDERGDGPLGGARTSAQSSAQRIDNARLVEVAGAAITRLVGEGEWVAGFTAPYLFLTPEALAHPRSATIREAATAAIAALPGIHAAYDTSRLAALVASEDLTVQRVLRSVHPESSGEVFVVPRPHSFTDAGITPGKGTTHGSPWDYDLHVPVWLLAPGIEPARRSEPFDQGRVATTIAAMMGIPPPATAADAQPLPGVGNAPAGGRTRD